LRWEFFRAVSGCVLKAVAKLAAIRRLSKGLSGLISSSVPRSRFDFPGSVQQSFFECLLGLLLTGQFHPVYGSFFGSGIGL
jgi:hypothetical protein